MHGCVLHYVCILFKKEKCIYLKQKFNLTCFFCYLYSMFNVYLHPNVYVSISFIENAYYYIFYYNKILS